MFLIEVLVAAFFFQSALGADVGCTGSTSGGNSAIGCVERGCCQWNNHITSTGLCDGANEVCCYSGLEPGCSIIGGGEGGDVGCTGSTSGGNPAIGCVDRGCCEWNNHITSSGLCSGSDQVCCYSRNICGGGGGIFPCSAQVCSSNPGNIIRGCDPMGCGHYGASRGSRSHAGSDVNCVMGSDVYAAFDGVLRGQVIPYGSGSCCDDGIIIDGSGAWSGYTVWYFYVRAAIPYGSTVTAGQRVATHLGLHCGCYGTSMTDHVHFQLFRNGVIIDPTSNLNC